MSEKPLERLNYYNGQRLEAADLKLEQEYHIRVRRWLNKSLYSTGGIAQGLTVRVEKDKEDKDVIVVGPGLAIDNEGREIILLDEHRPQIQPACLYEDFTGYLCIQYHEEKTAEASGSCLVRPQPGGGTGNRPAWGGPARIVAEPVLGFYPEIPPDSSGKIVLAMVTVDSKNCSVIKVLDTSVRRYIGAASASKVNQYALEGERHIDKNNPGRIYFHIRGRQPHAVTLYLRAECFSTLFYTELGNHDHNLSDNRNIKEISAPILGNNVEFYNHSHMLVYQNPETPGNPTDIIKSVIMDQENYRADELNDFKALDEKEHAKDKDDNELGPLDTLTNGKGHTHMFTADYSKAPSDSPPLKFNMSAYGGAKNDMIHWSGGRIYGGQHTHSLTLNNTGPVENDSNLAHTHPSVNIALGNAGCDLDARTGAAMALTYIKNLKIAIDKYDPTKDPKNRTDDILQQLADRDPVNWKSTDPAIKITLGDSNAGHPLVTNGTGPIRLDFLTGLSFDESDGGEYVIALYVEDTVEDPNDSGGKILYNLYVE
ncbi:MAG: hypothetical protein WC600_08655 [Desulfobaccales bacterium]